MYQSFPKASIIMPTYNGSQFILRTLNSLFEQDFSDWELIASDDCSTDDTYSIIKSIEDERVRCFQNEWNLGYPGNLSAAVGLARGEIVFLLGQDDLLLPGALRMTIEAFGSDEDIGVATRPYYWFYDDPNVAVREVSALRHHDAIFSLSDGPDVVRAVFASLGQLSGLAIRRSMIQLSFHENVFTSHIYPVAEVLSRHKGVFLAVPTVAVRIVSSQTRFKSEIYSPPPLRTWVDMTNTIFKSPKHNTIRRDLLEFLGDSNFLDLIQIRNYSTFRILFTEIGIFIKLRPRNIINLKFLVIVAASLLIPRFLLRRIVDIYKKIVLSRILRLRVNGRVQ